MCAYQGGDGRDSVAVYQPLRRCRQLLTLASRHSRQARRERRQPLIKMEIRVDQRLCFSDNPLSLRAQD